MELSFSLLLSYLLFFTFSFFNSVQPLCDNDDRIALLRLKNSFAIKKSVLKDHSCYPKVATWKLEGNSTSSADCCSWDGVECNEQTGHVTALDLSSSCLYGSINSNNGLFHLSQLQSLNLADNYFNYSRIPSKFGHLSRLVYLNLSSSFFYGQIPSEISQLSNLSSLDMSNNVGPSNEMLLKLKSPNFSTFVGNLSNLRQLDLSYVDISSLVPNFLANFSSLTSLRLCNCRLNGEFPNGIFNLPNLKFLYLEDNQNLSGHFPKFQYGGSLQHLFLSSTSFTGAIPFSIGKLDSLTRLSAKYCKFSGLLPPSLGNLTKLTYLDLLGNNVTGHIPPQLTNLTELSFLSLESNKLYGPLPNSISRLKNLQHLNLGYNELDGKVDFDIFLNMTYLTDLELSFNKFSVFTNNIKNKNATDQVPQIELLGLEYCNINNLPSFLWYQNRLIALNLGRNNIGGPIPKWLWNTSIETLEYLLLHDNFFTSFEQPAPVILPWLRLRIVHLGKNMMNGPLPIPPLSTETYIAYSNNFTGEISPLFCNLRSLQFIDLSNNKLSGVFPECLKNLNTLSILNLRSNHFHGNMPQVCTHRSQLRMLDLSHNQFQGSLEGSLHNCTKLEGLLLQNNQLDCVFPYQLGTLPELKILILRSNHLHGVIDQKHVSNSEFPNLRVIDLSHNSFSGLLPSEYFKKWIFMKAIDAGNSSYLEITKTHMLKAYYSRRGIYRYSITVRNKGLEIYYGNVQSVFVLIDLSSNKFEGEIPECIGNLTGLQVLNLSNNILSGNIPSSLGNMGKLESLDLSKNELSGTIPQQLKALTFLAHFNVSHNQLTGPIPQGNQFDTFESISYQGNLGLFGYPLPEKCKRFEASTPLLPSNSEEEEEEYSGQSLFENNWMTILPGFLCGLVVGAVIEQTVTTKKHKRMVKDLFGWGRRGA